MKLEERTYVVTEISGHFFMFRPKTPLSAPSTYSLSASEPFTFTLTFSTDAAYPITVHADRAPFKFEYTDIEVLEAASRRFLAPDLHLCRDGNKHTRDEFLSLEGTYTKCRILDFGDPFMNTVKLEVGAEYVLRHLGETWWWTEDAVDEVMNYLGERSSLGLMTAGTGIEVAGAGEVKFRIVG
jgi:hypothetical protein